MLLILLLRTQLSKICIPMTETIFSYHSNYFHLRTRVFPVPKIYEMYIIRNVTLVQYISNITHLQITFCIHTHTPFVSIWVCISNCPLQPICYLSLAYCIVITASIFPIVVYKVPQFVCDLFKVRCREESVMEENRKLFSGEKKKIVLKNTLLSSIFLQKSIIFFFRISL